MYSPEAVLPKPYINLLIALCKGKQYTSNTQHIHIFLSYCRLYPSYFQSTFPSYMFWFITIGLPLASTMKILKTSDILFIRVSHFSYIYFNMVTIDLPLASTMTMLKACDILFSRVLHF